MKKSLLLASGTFCVALLMTGCAGITTNNGGVAPISSGQNFYTALKQVPGAQDLVDVKMDYSMKNICGINEVTVTLTGTAVKFNK